MNLILLTQLLSMLKGGVNNNLVEQITGKSKEDTTVVSGVPLPPELAAIQAFAMRYPEVAKKMDPYNPSTWEKLKVLLGLSQNPQLNVTRPIAEKGMFN